MSNDLFANFRGNARSTVGDNLANGSISRQAWLANVEDGVDRARTQLETDTPENRQKTAEDRAAERERKKFAFDTRALPRYVMEGWTRFGGGQVDEEVKVYTRTKDWRHRFWGIKPIGMTLEEFWERHDPDVLRFHDSHQECPLDPENPSGPLIGEPVKDLPSTAEAVAKSRRRQKTPELNAIHKVRKPKGPSRKTNKKSTRKSLAEETAAGSSRLGDQSPEEPDTAPITDSPSRNEKALPPPTPQHEPAPKDQDQDQLQATSKRPRRHPAHTADPAPATYTSQAPKRPRGRPRKAHPATKKKDASTPKRPRGRPPGKGKPTAAVQGNARVTKPSASENQKGRRALAPSTHVMRTRGKGAAESLQLP